MVLTKILGDQSVIQITTGSGSLDLHHQSVMAQNFNNQWCLKIRHPSQVDFALRIIQGSQRNDDGFAIANVAFTSTTIDCGINLFALPED
jgi:hypothetical protein